MNYEVKNLRNLLIRARQAGGPWSDDFLTEMALALGEPNTTEDDNDGDVKSNDLDLNLELKISNCHRCHEKDQCCGCPMGRRPTVEQSEWCRTNDCPKC